MIDSIKSFLDTQEYTHNTFATGQSIYKIFRQNYQIHKFWMLFTKFKLMLVKNFGFFLFINLSNLLYIKRFKILVNTDINAIGR